MRGGYSAPTTDRLTSWPSWRSAHATPCDSLSYGGDFIARARRLGIETILTPVHAPNANAIAECVIGTLRRECLNHVIAVNEQHLRRVLGEYVQHYNAMRPHRSLALDSPEGRSPVQRTPSQRVVSKPVLGGLHHEYRWAA